MVRLILIFIIISFLAGSVYFKFAPKPNNLEDRIKTLENVIVSIRSEKKPTPTPKADYEERIKSLEQTVAQLKSQKLSNDIPARFSPLYIPLGSGGTAGDKGWYSVPGYEVLVDPVDYAGYSGMQMEVNFRMTEVAGVGMARLYNQTDNRAASGEVTIASDNFSLQATPNFKLPAGRKTYRLQIKSTYGVNLEIQSARIKVSF